uniref:Protein SZT2 n=1 Tax=Setaria digitata TaxID=48799 RepID=A0A915Q6J3_9BILA
MNNCFCLRSLLINATERELLLLPTLTYQNEDQPSNIRLRILLESLHCELAKASNVTIEVRNSNFWLDITDGIDQSVLKRPPANDYQRSSDGNFCPTRIYVSRLSPWRVIITALLVNPQHILMATSRIVPTIPLLIFHCDEPWIAHHLARNEPWRCEIYVSDHRTKSPTSTLAHLNRQIRKTENFTKMQATELELHWLSTSRISATENRVHTSFDLHSYCESIEDHLFSRALIGAVYRSLLQGVHIPYEDLVEVLEDRCEQSDIEVEGIDECVRFLCSHVENILKQTGDSSAEADDETRSNDFFKDDILYRLNDGEGKSCEEEQEDFRCAFDELLSQNFRKIPNFPSYFYFVRDNGTNLGNKNLTINLPEAKSFTCGNSSCENLEICYVEDEEGTSDANRKFQSTSDSTSDQSSISFESVTASESSDGENFHLSDNAAVPLFLNFSCAIRFSNMDMYTFPIDHLPSCVMQLLKQCSDISKKNFTGNVLKVILFSAMDLIGISFDIYVLSWPVRQFTLAQSDSYTVSPKIQDNSAELLQKSINYFDFDDLFQENEAVRRLECGITRLLHMETVFVLSRYDDVTLDTLHKVMVFVASEERANSDPIRFRIKSLQLVMVMEHVKAIRRLKERIKNFNLLYCKLEPHSESSNLFYCCRVADVNLYENTLVKQTHSRTALKLSRRSSSSFTERVEDQVAVTAARKVSSMEMLNTSISREKVGRRRDSSVPISKADRRLSEDYADNLGTTERTRCSDHVLRDFWIILSVEMQQVQAFFCERYAHHHEKVFEYLLETIQNECHTINQELLLEKLHSTSECDSLLIENEAASHKFNPSNLHDSFPDTKLTRSLVHNRAAPKTKKNLNFSYSDEEEVEVAPYTPARVFYPPGHFACKIVAHHWFYIHPRLHIELRGTGCSLVMGFDALRQGIEQFAVRNRRNLYVYCEDNKRNVFYMQLFASEESFKERCSHCDTTIIDGVSEKFQNNVLLTVHGIHEPATVIQSIVDTMQKRLELKVLEELTNILHKNPHTRLTATDVEFIQRDPARPFAVHYCTLPNYIYRYLGSVYYYMYQQMLTFTTEARFRDHNDEMNRSSPLSHERSCFHSQSGSQQACDNYIPHFFLINKPPTKGSSNMGIACVETRIVSSSGVSIDSLKYARISSTTHSKLYPGGGKFRLSSNERFHELTRCITTSLPLPDSLLTEKPGGVSYLVQYTIWQVGDVGLASLQPIFRLALQQALCDLVSEFGLLSIHLLETVVTTRYPSSNALLVPYPTSEQRIRSRSDASHSNVIAKALRKAESHVQSPILEQLPQHLASHKSKSTGKTFSVDRMEQSLSTQRGNGDCGSACIGDCDEVTASVNYQFVAVAAQWFDHVVSEVKNTEHQFSVKRHTFHCESDYSIQKVFNVIRNKLSVVLKNETIIICQVQDGGPKRFSTHNFSDEDTITFSDDSGRIVAAENEEPSLIMLAYNHYYSEAILKYGADSRSNIIPTAVEEVLQDPKANSIRFLPQIAPFVPRQHLLYLVSKGETATLYLYNYSSDAAEQVHRMVANILSWQNARSRLLREIGLHKMGVTHLLGRITPAGEELVWLNSELLSEYEIPQHGSVCFDKRLVSGTQYIQAEPLMHLYRHTTLAFLPFNLNCNNLFEDQCSQMVILEKQMKSMLHDCEQFNEIHSALINGVHEISESDLLKITSHSRGVHFVRSPLLLFPKWRKLVAVVRRGTGSAMSFEQPLVTDLPARHASGSKTPFLENSSLISQMRSTRSNTFNTLSHSSDRALRKIRKSSEDDEPCCLKIQFMLVESYVKYLEKNGLRLLDVTTASPATRQANARYSLHYNTQNTGSPPNIWMCKACDGGILFVHITIIEPHFSVEYLLWDVAQLNRLKIRGSKKFDYKDQRDLDALKDSIISKAHVHSFTYDFHLRMVATYLIGGQQMTFPNLPVTNQKVWEYMLDEKRDNWRVVRLKTVEMDIPGQFMIVTEDDKNCFGLAYKEIRAIVYESQLHTPRTLNIKFYVMLVSHEKTDPFVENLELSGSRQRDAKISGEFKKFEGLNVSYNVSNSMKSSENNAAKDNAINVWGSPMTEGGRRRCHSGDNNQPEKKTSLPRNYSNGAKLDECHSTANERTQKLSIQNIAPLRHRRTRPDFRGSVVLSNLPTIVPHEQAFYIYYMNRRQKKLQDELEDSVMHYKRKLQMVIEDAVWHCKRNQLWDDMLEKQAMKRESTEMIEQRKLLARYSYDVAAVLRLALSTSLTTTDLDNLLGYVKSEPLNIYEPLLDSVVSNLNSGAFFKLLIQNFGVQKCRLFCSSAKEHLVIITPEAQQDVFLLTAQNDEPLQMRLLAKEIQNNGSGSLLMEADHRVREQFNELVRCAATSAWMNLVHSSSLAS